MKCGKGHDHQNVDDVRRCYGVQPRSAVAVATGPTEKQASFLRTLREERGLALDGIERLSRADASDEIGRLLKLPKVAKAPGTQEAYPQVPAGHYAIPSATGHNDLDFYRVDRPEDGAYRGRTFVKRVIGGRPDVPVRGAEAVRVLKAILAETPEKATLRYGQEIGRCGKCNRHLTDETSRARGIGPDCWAAGYGH